MATIFYNRFQSVISQIPTAMQIIPAKFEQAAAPALYDYEPGEEEILADLLPRGVATQVVAHLIRIARQREINLAYLTAADDAAARIYMRAGFAATGLLQTNIGKPARVD